MLPAIVVHWNQDVYADIELQHHDSIASAILDAPVSLPSCIMFAMSDVNRSCNAFVLRQSECLVWLSAGQLDMICLGLHMYPVLS